MLGDCEFVAPKLRSPFPDHITVSDYSGIQSPSIYSPYGHVDHVATDNMVVTNSSYRELYHNNSDSATSSRTQPAHNVHIFTSPQTSPVYDKERYDYHRQRKQPQQTFSPMPTQQSYYHTTVSPTPSRQATPHDLVFQVSPTYIPSSLHYVNHTPPLFSPKDNTNVMVGSGGQATCSSFFQNDGSERTSSGNLCKTITAWLTAPFRHCYKKLTATDGNWF